MKSLEDVDEVLLGETVEVGDDGVQFVDPVLLLVRGERAAGDLPAALFLAQAGADFLGPAGEAVVGAGEAASQVDGAAAERVVGGPMFSILL